MKSYIAITHNPATGRPESKVLDLPIEGTDGILCASNPSLSVVTKPSADQEVCTTVLKIEGGACPEREIGNTDSGFDFVDAPGQ